MDATDKRILKRLQENARVTVSVLSQEISLSMPAISERLKKLENPTLPRNLQKTSQESEEFQRFSLLFLYLYVIII